MNNKAFILKIVVSLALVLFGVQDAMSQRPIRGKITDCEGKPLAGAVVRIEKDGRGTVSNVNGEYGITARNRRSVLTFSFPGHETKDIKVRRKKVIDVSLMAQRSVPGIMVRKPVIYLYPEVETDVSVVVDFDGKFLFTYPEYGKGWNVTASPDGTLTDKTDGRQYSYLFWDGDKVYAERERSYDAGYVVHRDSTVAFLQGILPQYGLRPHEYNEFIVYWVPFLKQHEWSFIHFRNGADYDVISKNTVTPQPRTEIRVFMDFRGVGGHFEVAPQKPAAPERQGFTLVEWGGREVNKPIRVKVVNAGFREI